MDWKSFREREAEELDRRIKESEERKGGGPRFSGIFAPELSLLLWQCKAAVHELDIIPYITSTNNPDPSIKAGSLAYTLTVWVHENIGSQNARFVCPATYGRNCPVCNERQRLQDVVGLAWNAPEVKALMQKKVNLYNIVCYDTPEEQTKGVQVWEVKWWNFERYLIELAKATPRGGGRVPFPSSGKNGKSIVFTRSGKGQTDTTYIGHKFKDRDYEIPEEMLAKALCLEDLIHVPTDVEIMEILHPSEDTPADVGRHSESVTTREEPPVQPTSGRYGRSSVPTQEQPQQKDCIPDFNSNVNVGECIAGGTIGIDLDTFDQCKTTCTVWDDCAAKAEQLEKAKREQQERSRLARSNSRGR